MSDADPLRTVAPAQLESASERQTEHAITAAFIRYNAARDLTLYERTGEEHLVLRVYEAHRKAGLAIPDRVLAIFDEWAARPVSPTAARAIRAASAKLDVVQHIGILEGDFGLPPNDAARAVAAFTGRTFGAVKTIKSRWLARLRPKAVVESTQSAADLQAVWSATAVTRNGELL